MTIKKGRLWIYDPSKGEEPSLNLIPYGKEHLKDINNLYWHSHGKLNDFKGVVHL